jgi:16S rRNA G1207 methylase RsmC
VAPSTVISRFVNKSVAFRFKGRDLSFHLSHALFSSFNIDDGTRLLLKTLAQNVELGSLRSALDIGCGVGVIGAAVAAHAASATIVMQDRDALAAAFALENCRLNRLENVEVRCALAFHGLGGRSFDLVTSNLPAKAGRPVLRSLFRHAAGCLSAEGIAAVVIVAPLASFARETLGELGCAMERVEETRAYTVMHFRAGRAGPETDGEREDLSPYIRASAGFSTRGCSYRLHTAYSLPDFDTLGYAAKLSLDVLEDAAPARSVVVWNPGQGHLPVGLLAQRGRSISSLGIAGRDCLECAISQLNLSSLGRPPVKVAALASEEKLGDAFSEGSIDLLIAAPRPIPRVPWQADLARAAARLLKRGGELFVVESSTGIHRLLEQPAAFRSRTSRKQYGFRAAILIKP